MATKSIKQILSNYLKGSKYQEITEIIKLNTSWQKIVGKSISKNTELISIKKGKIIIRTTNPIWRNELTLQKTILLNKLKQKEPGLDIKEIEFK